MSHPMARVVADADVLAADLFIDGSAREAMDLVREHAWVELLATEGMIDDAAAVIGSLGDEALAERWRTAIDELATVVEGRPGDHPALAAALAGEARHLLTLDEALLTARAGATVRSRVETSPKHPAAFVSLFDPDSVRSALDDGPAEGRSRD